MDTRIDKSDCDPFSRQIRSGFGHLVFDGDLEREYRVAVREGQRKPAQLCAWMALVAWGAFACLDFARISTLDLWSRIDWLLLLWLGARWSVLAFIVFSLVFLRFSRRPYDWLLWAVYVTFGVAVAVTSVIGRVKGTFSADSSQIIVVMAAFMPLGFVFYRALAAAIIVALAGAFFLWFEDGRGAADRIQLAVMVLLAVPVAAMGGYLREYSERRSYLLMGVLNQQATHDPLTGLANRRQLIRHAATAMEQAKRSGARVFLAVMDIDYFKQYNDLYGHPEGDKVLSRVGDMLADIPGRSLDLAARVGGEEFCLLLYGGDEAYAIGVLEKLVADMRALKLPHEGSPFGAVTFSAGLTECSREDDFNSLFVRADAALYEAKRNGRARLQRA